MLTSENGYATTFRIRRLIEFTQESRAKISLRGPDLACGPYFDQPSLMPYSHTIFLHTYCDIAIKRYCDKKIKRHFFGQNIVIAF